MRNHTTARVGQRVVALMTATAMAATGVVMASGSLAGAATSASTCAAPTTATSAQLNSTTGITKNSVTVGNISIISGPVPGLFQGATYGVEAYFDYINSQGGVNGRKLYVKSFDDAFSGTQNQSETTQAVSSLFATVENPIEIPEAALNLISESKVLISEMSAKSYSEDEYDSFAADIEAIKEKLNEASSYGGAQISSDEWSDVKKLSKEYLEGLSPAELQKIAGEKGFSNAGLVGIGMDTGTGHPLAFWLNPYYDAEEQKEKILQNLEEG